MRVIDNLSSSNHLQSLNDLIFKYENIILCSGWINIEGIELISDSLKKAADRGATIFVATNAKHTDSKCIDRLKELKIRHVIVKKSKKIRYFHTKLFFFEGNGEYSYIIGSANLTEGALLKNEELSICISGVTNDLNHQKIQPYIDHIKDAYFSKQVTLVK